jgi:hypothetical protein
VLSARHEIRGRQLIAAWQDRNQRAIVRARAAARRIAARSRRGCGDDFVALRELRNLA